MTNRLQGISLDDRHRRAQLHFSRGMYALAREEFEALLDEQLDTQDRALELHWRVSMCCAAMGFTDEADERVDAALELPEVSPVWRARLQSVRGFSALARGNYPLAREVCEESASQLRDVADHEGLTCCLRWLATTHLRTGDLELAFENAYAALSEARHASLTADVAHAHGVLTAGFIQRGQYGSALDHGKMALGIAERLGHKSSIIRHNIHLSVAARLAGDLDLAANYAMRGLAVAEEADFPNLTISARLAGSRAMKESGRIEGARELAENALVVAETSQRERDKVLVLEDLGDLDFVQGNIRGALEKYRVAWRRAETIAAEGDLVAELGWRIGTALLELGDTEGSRPWIDKSIAVGEKCGERKEVALALRARALWYARARRGDEALRDLENALSTLESLQVSYEVARTHVAFDRVLRETSSTPSKVVHEREFHLSRAAAIFDQIGAIGGSQEVQDLRSGLEGVSISEPVEPVAPRRRPSTAGVMTREWESHAYMACLDECRKLGPTNLPLLLVGRTGTGKTLLADSLHRLGRGDEGEFFSVNCAALPDHLQESELFGHKKGAFTGAEREHRGIFREAGRGTVFLDEIDKTSLEFQAKLLQVLDSREVRPVGCTKLVPIDARIICATNRDLFALVEEGKFLEDLHHRLMCGIIQVPSLRDRVEDLPMLSGILLGEIAALERTVVPQISEDGWQVLMAHSWPGNVRELKSLLHRAVALNRGTHELDAPTIVESAPMGSTLLRQEQGGGTSTSKKTDLAQRMRNTERAEILHAFRRAGGVRKKAAEILGISYRGLGKKMARLGIDPERVSLDDE